MNKVAASKLANTLVQYRLLAKIHTKLRMVTLNHYNSLNDTNWYLAIVFDIMIIALSSPLKSELLQLAIIGHLWNGQ